MRGAGPSNQGKAKAGEVGRALQTAISPYGQAWRWPPSLGFTEGMLLLTMNFRGVTFACHCFI